jgi:hypothetical protein
VNDALARGLVQLPAGRAQRRSGLLHIAGVGGLTELPDRRLQRGLDRFVAESRLLVLLVALDLGFNVRHAKASLEISSGRPSRQRRAPEGHATAFPGLGL